MKAAVFVEPGRIVLEELGASVVGFEVGQRVIAGAITPCGQCGTCLDGQHAQRGGRAMGGLRLGNQRDGVLKVAITP